MLKYALLFLTLMAGQAVAQTLPSADVDTVRSGIGEEMLAPPPKPVVAVMASATVVAVSNALVVSATDMFTVKNVVITLSDTTGFDRDAALEKGARQVMPEVLVGMGMPKDDAVKAVKGVGSAMTFVKGFKVVKETLIPNYILTADLTFNEAILRKNFGGKITTKAVAVSVTEPAAEVEGVTDAPLKQWIIRVVDRDPVAVEKVRTNLNAQAATRATYRLLTSNGAEMVVDTPMTAMEINRVAGHEVMVSELETALPGIVSGSWQGTPTQDPGAAEGTY